MKNQQAPERRINGLGQLLDVHSIFDTIQGEGPYAGQPATFIRLAGCNLQCPLCDTEYTAGREVLDIETIIRRIGHANNLIVITGGEPFRQNLAPLVTFLTSMRRKVQIETNGKFDCGSIIPELATIVVSPKTATIHPNIAMKAHAYKYVVVAGNVADDRLPITALYHPVPHGKTVARPPKDWTGPIYVQPADEKDYQPNKANMKAAVAAVLHDPNNRRLCIQMHKYANLD